MKHQIDTSAAYGFLRLENRPLHVLYQSGHIHYVTMPLLNKGQERTPPSCKLLSVAHSKFDTD